MRFLIVGDSFGCGEWRKDFSDSEISPGPDWVSLSHTGWYNDPNNRNHKCWVRSRVVPNTDVGYYLRDSRHACTNLCVGGDTNFNQLTKINEWLKRDSDFDFIIWFYTEPGRDNTENKFEMSESKINNMLSEYEGWDLLCNIWHRATLDKMQAIYDQFKIPVIMIGGMEVVPNMAKEYSFYCASVDDWANDLIFDEKIPHPSNFSKLISEIGVCYLDSFDKIRLNEAVDEAKLWLEYTSSHPRYPDWGHPDRQSHEELAAWILERIPNNDGSSLLIG